MTGERMPRPGGEEAPGAAGAEAAPVPAENPEPAARNLEPAAKPLEEGFLRADAVSHSAEGRTGDEAAGEAPVIPTVEAPSPDVDLAQEASPLPGAHRGGFHRLPTAPVAVTVETAPAEPGGEFTPDDTSWAASDSTFQRGLAGWALAFAIVGLLVSMFVGWGFPIGIVAVVSAIIALRRPLESRAVAIWAIALGTVSILYSAGWLLFAGFRANLFG